MSDAPSPEWIDAYLDQMLVHLDGRARNVRRILAETEAHLEDAYAAARAEGLDPDRAAIRAVERFGAPAAVARRFQPDGRAALGALTALAAAALLLIGVGLVAIGVSGVVSMVMRSTLGSSFVAGDLDGVTYTPERCADFLEYHPEADSCGAAAAAHHADEVETYRVAAGVLGLFVLAAYFVWHRVRPRSGATLARLPLAVLPAVGAATFGAAGVLLSLEGLSVLLGSGRPAGPGQWLSGGVVALVVAAGFDVLLLRSLMRPTPIAA